MIVLLVLGSCHERHLANAREAVRATHRPSSSEGFRCTHDQGRRPDGQLFALAVAFAAMSACPGDDWHAKAAGIRVPSPSDRRTWVPCVLLATSGSQGGRGFIVTATSPHCRQPYSGQPSPSVGAERNPERRAAWGFG